MGGQGLGTDKGTLWEVDGGKERTTERTATAPPSVDVSTPSMPNMQVLANSCRRRAGRCRRPAVGHTNCIQSCLQARAANDSNDGQQTCSTPMQVKLQSSMSTVAVKREQWIEGGWRLEVVGMTALGRTPDAEPLAYCAPADENAFPPCLTASSKCGDVASRSRQRERRTSMEETRRGGREGKPIKKTRRGKKREKGKSTKKEKRES